MSLKTWKKEFYPTSAGTPSTDREAVLHSLRKWKGLTPANLKKHKVSITDDDDLTDSTWEVFLIGAETCALCESHYYLRSQDDSRPTCPTCPLQIALDMKCDQAKSGPFMEWCYHGRNPKPMIKALEKTLKGLQT